MRLKSVIGILLVLQAILFAHMTFLLTQTDLTGHVPAEAGNVTQVTVSHATGLWGGVYGRLSVNGSANTSITAGDVDSLDLYYLDPNNNCSRTEVFASVNPILDISETQPVGTGQADSILGFDSTHALSITQTFDEQLQFDLGGNLVTLQATRTNGQLTQFVQGVGINNGNIVFVAETVANGQAFDGTSAEYQLMLPTGNWLLDFDISDTCDELNVLTPLEEPQEQDETRLSFAIPGRVCLNQENILYAIDMITRLRCTPEEIGRWWCNPVEADVEIVRGGQTILSTTTDETGEIKFTPIELGTYQIKASTINSSTQTTLGVRECLDREHPNDIIGRTGEERIIRGQAPNIQAGELIFPDYQRPESILERAKSEFVFISLISIFVTFLGMIAYYGKHKDDSMRLLRMRIWLLERFSK